MMFPSNSYMDPYFSQNKEQVPYPPYPYSQNKEHIPYPSYPFYPYPVPCRPEPSAQSSSYGPWPNHFNPSHANGYPYPPGYYGPRPPYPYEIPPPNFPSYYHPYFTAMPNYPAKHPQLDHAEGQTHCCGCPNHVCHGTDSPRVKIDEEKPDMDLRKIPNNAYPFFRFPPRNKLRQDEVEKPKEEKKETQFPWPIVWMPDDGIKDKKEKKMKDAQFPWPIIWMPEDDANEKDQNLNKRVSNEAVKPSFRIIPLKFLEQGDKDQSEKPKFPAVEENRVGDQLSKELREHGDKDQSEVRNIPVVEKKVREKAGKEQAVKERESAGDKGTEKKHSKLPPVCLRLDPLPHKKPTNGSSNEGKNKKEVKAVDVKSAKGEGKEKEVRDMDVLKDKMQERKMDDVKRTSNAGENKIKKEIKVVDVKSAEAKELKENEKDLKELGERKFENQKRAKMSEQDAALCIQSVYRGYNVRRWDPLNKLKKIREVFEKAQELQGKLQHVEKSSTQLEKKERLVLSESIMNLLLQLDTIQGLHPTVREARKSVARELVSLQEKLDSLEKQKAVEAPIYVVQNAVEAPTNEVQQPQQLQLEVQPTATTVSSEECKSVSEHVEAPAGEHMMTQKEDENAHESGHADTFELPQSATDYHPVVETLPRNEEDACSTTEKSQLTPSLNDSEPVNNAGENDLNAQSVSPQTENPGSVSGTENVQLHGTEVVPSVAIERNTTDHAPAITLAKSSNEASIVLSDDDVHDTDVTPTVTEEIHDTEVPSGVVVTEKIKPETVIPETKNLDESGDVEDALIHATESDTKDAQEIAPESNTKDAQEIASEVTLCESAIKDVDLQAAEVTPEESHGSNAGVSVENVESQAIEVGMLSNEEKKVEDNEIAPEVKPEESHGSDAGASVENIELQAIEVGIPSNEENKVEDNEVSLEAAVTAFPEERMVQASQILLEECDVNDGDASAGNVELPASEADKLEELKSAEEIELTLPENKIPDGYQNVEQVSESQAELRSNVSNATEVSPEGKATGGATEGDKSSSEEKKLMEENEKLRGMLEKLLEAGRNQLDVISGLNERIRGLEKKLEKKSKKSKVRVMNHKPVMASPIKS